MYDVFLILKENYKIYVLSLKLLGLPFKAMIHSIGVDWL
jgi:hypothetical protein